MLLDPWVFLQRPAVETDLRDLDRIEEQPGSNAPVERGREAADEVERKHEFPADIEAPVDNGNSVRLVLERFDDDEDVGGGPDPEHQESEYGQIQGLTFKIHRR